MSTFFCFALIRAGADTRCLSLLVGISSDALRTLLFTTCNLEFIIFSAFSIWITFDFFDFLCFTVLLFAWSGSSKLFSAACELLLTTSGVSTDFLFSSYIFSCCRFSPTASEVFFLETGDFCFVTTTVSSSAFSTNFLNSSKSEWGSASSTSLLATFDSALESFFSNEAWRLCGFSQSFASSKSLKQACYKFDWMF